MAISDQALDDILQKVRDHISQEESDIAAIELLSIYLKERDKHGYALMLYGDCLRSVGRQTEAYRYLRKALRFTPSQHKYEVYVRIGLLRQIQSPKSAEKWFEKATTTAPNNVGWIFVLRAGNLMRLEQFDKSIAMLTIALKSDDVDYDEIYLNIGISYRALGKYELAKKSFLKALEYDQKSEMLQLHIDGLKTMKKNVQYLKRFK